MGVPSFSYTGGKKKKKVRRRHKLQLKKNQRNALPIEGFREDLKQETNNFAKRILSKALSFA